MSVSQKLAYSISELGTLAGLGRSYLYEEIKAGRLATRKAGRRTLVLRLDADRWLASMPATNLVPSHDQDVTQPLAGHGSEE